MTQPETGLGVQRVRWAEASVESPPSVHRRSSNSSEGDILKAKGSCEVFRDSCSFRTPASSSDQSFYLPLVPVRSRSDVQSSGSQSVMSKGLHEQLMLPECQQLRPCLPERTQPASPQPQRLRLTVASDRLQTSPSRESLDYLPISENALLAQHSQATMPDPPANTIPIGDKGSMFTRSFSSRVSFATQTDDDPSETVLEGTLCPSQLKPHANSLERKPASRSLFKDRQRLSGLGSGRYVAGASSPQNHSTVQFAGGTNVASRRPLRGASLTPFPNLSSSCAEVPSTRLRGREALLNCEGAALSASVGCGEPPVVAHPPSEYRRLPPSLTPRFAVGASDASIRVGNECKENMIRQASVHSHTSFVTEGNLSFVKHDTTVKGYEQGIQEKDATMCTFDTLLPTIQTESGAPPACACPTSPSAATRLSGRRSTYSSLLFSMLKMPRVQWFLPSVRFRYGCGHEDEASCEAWDCNTVFESLSSNNASSLVVCGGGGGGYGVGVIETEEHVFIPVYELLQEGSSQMEVMLESIRAMCSCSDNITIADISRSGRTRNCSPPCLSSGTSAQNVGDMCLPDISCNTFGYPGDQINSESISCLMSGSYNVPANDRVDGMVDTEGFTFGVVSPTYVTSPADEAVDIDCKVAARFLFDSEKGVMIISAEEEVKKYISHHMYTRNSSHGNGGNGGGNGLLCRAHSGNEQKSGVATGQGQSGDVKPCDTGGVSTATSPSCKMASANGADKGTVADGGSKVVSCDELEPVSRCRCTREAITRYFRGFDYSRYHAHKLYHHCHCCGRRPAAFLCLHCFTSTCPSHVTRHYNESIQGSKCDSSGGAAESLCTLFINILNITTSFDRVFWCEPCRSFTWQYTEVYDPFVDQLAVTRGTYLQDPVRDIVCVGYEVQLKSPSCIQSQFSPSLHASPGRDRFIVGVNSVPQTATLFTPSTNTSLECKSVVAALEGVNGCSSVTPEAEEGTSIALSTRSHTDVPCAQVGGEAVHVGVTTTRLVSLGAKMQGWRATQEDAEAAFTIEIPAFPSRGDGNAESQDERWLGASIDTQPDTIVMAVFCVFDGHGGDAVAKLAASRFEKHLRKAIDSGRHNEVQARAVLRRLDLESTTPIPPPHRIVPHPSAECRAVSPGGHSAASAEHSNAVCAEQSTAHDFEEITVDSLHRHVRECHVSPLSVEARGISLPDHSITSHTGPLVPQSPLVSRGEMELLRLYFAGVMEDALLSLDDELRYSAEGRRGDYNCVGSTACVVGITTNFILCANVGDSGAAFYTPYGIEQISITHRTSDPAESSRITAAGYAIEDNRIEGVLAVPRALGDYDFKQCGGRAPQEQAVVAVPDVTIMPVPPQAAAGRWGVVVACDGVWDSATLHQVHHAIMNTPNDLDVATSAADAILRGKEIAAGLGKGSSPCDDAFDVDVGNNNSDVKASIDALLLTSAAGVFAQCVAPIENDEGIGMDNCSLFIIEQR
ncbi:putative Protein phosphatase 2C [Trypanosoma vivax]|uniref:protein-serine/threonine phosphatase n=1 Tax=Trypanosoma vivax (strain Y486) TaxID=1055687 RepID=G0TUU8_TRYVY|nr:hypothetical protein TRVL_06962 [Trypanosoma vivax]KAH8611035.1 putative Protein phosphatase 2C [Trypanosoma vivax]CCC47735.1 conserved hypothetical protein [Trypanosoma vivax Y486]